LIFVTAQAGGAIFPSLIGLIATHAGVKVLQPISTVGMTGADVDKLTQDVRNKMLETLMDLAAQPESRSKAKVT